MWQIVITNDMLYINHHTEAPSHSNTSALTHTSTNSTAWIQCGIYMSPLDTLKLLKICYSFHSFCTAMWTCICVSIQIRLDRLEHAFHQHQLMIWSRKEKLHFIRAPWSLFILNLLSNWLKKIPRFFWTSCFPRLFLYSNDFHKSP